ncbi:hypothetical protein J4437_02375 [Candidatus Woesearchaeota archaeon]|nr:hypothetical protein [Candidatus Woesearchaeota archaeon]
MFANLLNQKRSVSIMVLACILITIFSSLSLAESLPLRPSSEATSIGLPPRESEDGLAVTENELINNLTKVLQPLFKGLNLVLGGIFGVYLIMVISRLYYERKKVQLLKAILYDLDKLNEHYKINNSRSRVGLVKKIMLKLNKWFRKGGNKK